MVWPRASLLPNNGRRPNVTIQRVASRPWDEKQAAEIIAAHRDVPGAMLPVLHALQDSFGYIDPAAIPLVAEALNVSRAEVHGVIGFYHDFREAPAC